MNAKTANGAGRVAWFQVRALVANALRLDARSVATAAGGRRMRSRLSLPMSIVITTVFGAQVAKGLAGYGLTVDLYAAVVYALTTILALLFVMIECNEKLWPASEADILSWRPISAPTMFLFRVLHVALHVALLALPLLARAAYEVAQRAAAAPIPTALAFLAGGYLSALFAALILIGVYALGLRALPARHFQRFAFALQAFLLVATISIQLLSLQVMKNLDFASRAGIERLMPWLPAGWFASLPGIAAAGATPERMAGLAAAAGALLLAWLLSVHVFAHGFAATADSVSAPDAGLGVAEPGILARLGARWTTRSPAARAGFEFMLALMRGDRQMGFASLLMTFFPTAIALSFRLQGVLIDPYRANAPTADAARVVATGYAWLILLWGILRSLAHSPHWRAGWLFHAAPLRDLAGFRWGMYAAFGCTAILPSLLVQVTFFSIAWRNALHPFLQFGPPLGFAFLLTALLFLVDREPPLSRQPVRVSRSVHVFESMFFLLLVAVAVFAHAKSVATPWHTLALALGLAAVGLVTQIPARRRLNHLRTVAFEG
jgi:hypothetical protein